jgi:HJR/Mrr/RecB family endonuclease
VSKTLFFIVTFIVVYLFTHSLGITLLFFGFISVILLIISASQKADKEELVRALKLADVDNMGGVAFEKYVRKLLEHQGFSARVTPSTNDKGVDIVATKGDLKYAIQVKRYRSAISRRAVSDAVAGKNYYNCNASMVITNNYFTKGAIELSEAAECRLVDRDELTKWIIDFQSSEKTEVAVDVKNGTQLNGDLVVAVLIRDIQEVKELISKGANVNAKDENGLIPLISAAWLGRKDICELLVSNGADVNARDKIGKTALMYAVSEGHKDICELLKSHGAKE